MKRTKLFLAVLFAVQLAWAQAPSAVWKLDKSHSSITFTVDHLVISEVTGQFDDYAVNVTASKPDFTDAVFDVTIQVKSINTKEPKRDQHLQSPDFFDVAKYPTITFVGKKFEKVSGNQYKVTGDFTMHGVTKTITLDGKFGTIKDPRGNLHAGITVTGDIDRYDYGLKYNAAIEAGGVMIGQIVKIKCVFEFVQAK